MKKSLKPLNSPPPKLSSPFRTALRTAAHGVALAGLLVGGAVWTISQQQPVYANPGKLLRLPATVVDASPNTAEALEIGEFLNRYTKDRALASLRFGIGGGTSVDEIDRAASKVVEVVARLRQLSPAGHRA